MSLDIFFQAFFVLVFSFLVGLKFVPICQLIAKKHGIVDNPDGRLKVHKRPVPYLGGVAIYFGFALTTIMFFYTKTNLFLFMESLAFLMLVGLVDDLISLSPAKKFIGQFISAIGLAKSGFYLGDSYFNFYIAVAISIFWILSVINAFNLVDVMDGLATTIGAMAAFSYLIISIYQNNYTYTFLISAFLGPLLAFLVYNKPDAKIYLGDTGSLFIGGFLASVPYGLNLCEFSEFTGYLVAPTILGIALLEGAGLILIRLYKGLPIYNGSPDHFSIYMQKNGWSKTAILIFVSFYSLALSIYAFSIYLGLITIIQIAILSLIFFSIWVFFLKLKAKNIS